MIVKFPSVETLPQAFHRLTPIYKSRKFQPFHLKFQWDRSLADQVYHISPKRAEGRIQSYVSADEVLRAKTKLDKQSVSLRFGVKKEGHGISGSRGDFCLVAGVLTRKKHLTLYYRSLELLGGLHYDTCIMAFLEDTLEVSLRTIEIYAVEAHAFALKGNSNEVLYQKLKVIYEKH